MLWQTRHMRVLSSFSFVEQLNWHANQTTQALARLSSGQRLQMPQDDAGGLAVATRQGAQLRQYAATAGNLANAVSYTQTQGGYLQGAQNVLDRMGELAIRAQDGTLPSEQRALYQEEFHTLKDAFNDARTVQYNGVDVFNGATRSIPLSPAEGTVDTAGIDLFTPEINAVTALSTEVASLDTARNTLQILQTASRQIAHDRAGLGAVLNELQHASALIETQRTQITENLSRIQDTDTAQETVRLARERILTQSSVYALNQAHLQPQNVLNLLR